MVCNYSFKSINLTHSLIDLDLKLKEKTVNLETMICMIFKLSKLR